MKTAKEFEASLLNDWVELFSEKGLSVPAEAVVLAEQYGEARANTKEKTVFGSKYSAFDKRTVRPLTGKAEKIAKDFEKLCCKEYDAAK